MSPSMVSGVPADSTRDAEGPGDCGSGAFIGEELDGRRRGQEMPQRSM
jgi:hypothetical protein